MFPVPGSPAPPQWYGPPPLPAATYYVRLPTTCYSLLPIYYLLPITTYYYLLPTTNYYLPHTTPPHRGRGDWTMLLLLGYHDHGWGVGGGPRTGNIYGIYGIYVCKCVPFYVIRLHLGMTVTAWYILVGRWHSRGGCQPSPPRNLLLCIELLGGIMGSVKVGKFRAGHQSKPRKTRVF